MDQMDPAFPKRDGSEPAHKRRRLSSDEDGPASDEASIDHKALPKKPRPANITVNGREVEDSDRDDVERVSNRSRTESESAEEAGDSLLPLKKTPVKQLLRGSSPQDSADETDHASSPIPSPAPAPPARLRYRPRLILKGHKRSVSAVKFSPNGRWIASCSADATCKIWDAETGKHQHTFEGHLAGISAIAWNPDSRLLASGSDDKCIRLWDTSTGKPHPKAFVGHHNYVYCLAFSPKGNILVSGSYDEAVYLWDVRTGRIMRTLPAHGDPVGGVDFTRDGTLIASCASDGLIRVWDTSTGQCLRTFFHEDTPPATSVRFSPNGKYILAWMLDNSIRMWNYVDGRCVKTYQGHKNDKFSLTGAFGSYSDPPSALIASGSEDGFILFWDVSSKEVLQRLKGHQGIVFGVDMHPWENQFVSCGQDKAIRIWRDNTPNYEDEMDET